MAAPTKLSATERLEQLDREVEAASEEPAALKRRIERDQQELRESGALGYDLRAHADWPALEEMLVPLRELTEQRDAFRRRSVAQRVEEQVDAAASLKRVTDGLLELRDALSQLVADENTIVGIVSDGFGYEPRRAAMVVRTDVRVGQLAQLIVTIEEAGLEAPTLDAHAHRFLLGDHHIEVDRIARGEEQA